MASADGDPSATARDDRAESTLDPLVASQLTALALTSAINSQQLNAAAARNAVLSQGNSLVLSVQLTHLAGMRALFGTSPVEAAAAANLQQAAMPARAAGLKAT